MAKKSKNFRYQAKLILEELEARQLFSDGAAALAPPPPTNDAAATVTSINVDANLNPIQENTAQVTNDLITETPSPAATQAVNNPTSPAPSNTQDSTAVLPVTGIAPPQETPISKELVFVDTKVENYQALVDDITHKADNPSQFEVVLLDPNQDGISQITETLSHYKDLTAVHFITHGSDGSMDIGNSQLNFQTLIQHQEEINTWSHAFAEQGDILIYGCNVAQTQFGQGFVDYLSSLTGADIAASTDATGSTTLGADWNLEYQSGIVEAQNAISLSIQNQWTEVLAVTANGTVTSTSSTSASSLSWAHTVSSGSNIALFVEISIDAANVNATSVTYGGVALTLVGRTTGTHAVEIWRLVNPTVGTANVVVNLSGTSAVAAGASAFNGVNQSTPTGTFVGNSGSGVSILFPVSGSVSVASATGDLVIDAQYWSNSNANPVGPGQTAQWTQSSFWSSALGSSTTEAGAPTVTMSGSVSGLITLADWSIGAVSIKASVPGITITPTSGLTTTEAGGTAQFSVVLNTQPTANVTIGLTSSDLTEGTVSPSSLTFTSANWNTPQTVTITGVDDALGDGNISYSIVTAAATSADSNYNGLNASDVSVSNTDNDNIITVDTTSDTIDGNVTSMATLIANKGTDGKISLREAITAANNTANGATPDKIVFAIPQSPITYSNNTPVAIPDQSTITSSIVVANTGTVTDVNVQLNITHTYDGDLQLTLIAPDGTRIQLANGRGGSGDNYTNTIFDDQATNPIYTGTASFTGSYQPEVSLSSLNGKNAAGTWRLEVIDQFAQDTGTLNNWSLTLTTTQINPVVINVGSLLPSITQALIIDGTSQTGYTSSPLVTLNGNNAVTDGLQLYTGSSGSTIRGLNIQNFTQDGIDIASSNGNTIAGNYIGINAAGSAAAGNQQGINLWDANNNIIGGSTVGDRNVIAGNTGSGVFIGTSNGTGTGNQLINNYVGTNATGSAAIANGRGVLIYSASNIVGSINSTERNVISGNTNAGIHFEGSGATGNSVIGNYIGTNAAGTGDINGTAKANGQSGVVMNNGATSNRIGTNADGLNDIQERNIISGNNHYGVEFIGLGTSNNTVQGNYIGTDVTGQVALGNSQGGVSFWNQAANNQLGSGLTGAGNVISANETGVLIANGSNNNKVQGNFIGLAVDGITALGNTGVGVYAYNGGSAIAITGNVIGTDADGSNDIGERNVISANINGVVLQDAVISSNTIAGNYIGTDATGLLDRGNTYDGIRLENGAHNNYIGGAQTVQRNIIAGNDQEGIQITDEASDSNTILNNWIGLGSDGVTVIGNSGDGIFITGGADNTTIGGIGTGNVVMRSGVVGIEIDGASTGTVIQGNYVGINSAGTVVGGSIENGLLLESGASNTTIGGTTTGQGNVITDSGRGGAFTSAIDINPSAGIGNYIIANSIYGNPGLGIDLGVDGVTANDTLDPDTGGNNLQNFPVITSATTSGTGTVIVSGTLNTLSNLTGVVIQLYASPSAGNPTGRQGKRYLGSTTVSTDASGNATFTNITLSATVAAGELITATTTYANNTSEFSQGVALTTVNTAPTFSAGSGNATTPIGTGDDWARAMTLQADGKMVVAGYSLNGAINNFAVARYNIDGSLDTSFGTGGKTIIAVGSSTGQAYAVTIQANGKILIAGFASNGSNLDFGLVRLNTDGSLDTTFAGTGKVLIDFAGGTDEAQSVVVQTDGKIIIGGYTNANLFAMSRLNVDGTIDTSFGTAGKVTTDATAGLDSGYALTLQSDGKILFAGGGNNNFTLVRYNTNGSIDTGFGSSGIVSIALTGFGRSVIANSDGTILISGYGSDFKLAKLTSTGALDTSFGSGTGIVITDISGSDVAIEMAVQSDGKIILGGYNGTFNSTLVRYNVNGSLDTTFGNGGKVTTIIASGSFIEGLAVRSDGRIVVGITATVIGSRDFGVLSYLPDGSLDSAFNPTTIANTLDGNPTYTENGSAVVLDSNVIIFDAELSLNNYNGATLTLTRNGGASTQDVFSASGTLSTLTQGGNLVVGGVTVGTVTTNSNGILLLTFNANATQALVNSVMQQIAYRNSSDAPPASVQINWSFNDGNTGTQGTGGALIATGSTTVTITSVNDAPNDLYSLNGIAKSTLIGVYGFNNASNLGRDDAGNNAPITLTGTPGQTTSPTGSGALDLAGGGSGQYGDISGITTGGAMTFAGSVRFDSTGGWERVFDFGQANSTGIGNIYIAREFTTNNLTFTIEKNAGTLTTYRATASGVITNGTWLHFAATVDASGNMALYINGSLLASQVGVAPDIGVRVHNYIGKSNWDPDAGFDGAIDNLIIANGAMTASQILALYQQTTGFTVTENSANGTIVGTVVGMDPDETGNLAYTLTDSASGRFAINASTGQITVANGSLLDYESATSHNITVRVTDTTGLTYDETFTVNLTNVYEAPTATNLNASETYTEDSGLNLTDIVITRGDNASMTATITVSNTVAGSLNTATSGAVTSTYNAGTGVWTASGAIADVNALLAGLTFTPATNFNSNFTIATSVSDGTTTLTGTKTMTGTVVNDAPTATNLSASQTYTEDTALNLTTIVVSDVDSTTVTVTLTLSVPSAGSLNTGTSGAVTSIYNAGTGVWSASGALANVNTLLASLTFTPAANYNSNFTIATLVSDGALSVSGTKSMTGMAVNDAPTTSLVSLSSINEDSGGRVITQAELLINAADVEGNALTATNLSIASGLGSLLNNGNGTWTFTPTLNDDTAVSFSYTITDGNGGSVSGSANLDILAVNDAPIISSNGGGSTGTVNVAENQTNVTTVIVSDVDLPAQTISYSIIGGADAALFTINASTGILQFISGRNYESPTDSDVNNVYEVLIQVSDGAGGTDTQAVSVTITPVNEAAPVITSNGGGSTAAISRAENGTTLTTVTATDNDLPAPALTYSISGGTDAAKFVINSSTGVLSFIVAPNYENATDAGANNVYDVTVTVSDGSRTDTQDISVTINNLDEVAPTITSGTTATAINENSGANQVIYTVTSTDSGDIATGSTSYSLGGTDAGLFSINAATGAVTLLANPNFEAKASYSFTVTATDAAGNASSPTTVTLSVNNRDEVAPTITSGTTATAINENSGAGQVVYTVTSTDSGDIATGSTSYSLGGTDAGLFSINAATGAVTLLANPNFEAKASYSFTVTATDAAGNASSPTTVTLAINNLDEVAPTITSGTTATAINENSGAGQVVYTVTSTDSGDIATGSTSYSLGGTDAGLFSINAATGAVTLLANPNFEAKASYSFTVTATDAAGNASSPTTVTLAINNLDEVAPTITSGTTATAINENSGANQVIYTVTSTDSGDIATGSTSYSLGGTDAGLFSINAATGAVTLLANPNFEAKASYSFTVTATDAAGNASSPTTVTLSVNNRDEVAPTITSGTTATAINENSGANQVIYTVTSTDSGDIATGSTSYSLGGTDAGLFSINAATGAVTLLANPNFEAKASYSFTVTATDAAGNASSPTTVTLAINNLDEVAPTITSGTTATAINENSGAGQVVYTVTSTDSGDIATGSTSYSLGGTDAGLFSINAATGAVTLLANPNFEAKASYSFTVTATDAAGNASSPTTVTLSVNNRDEVAPTITSGTTATAINENSGAGQVVYTVTSTDSGDIATGSTSYSLGGTDAGLFSINAATGAVTLLANPNFEAKASYSFTVTATDAAGNASNQAVTLTINNLDDTAPTITSSGTAPTINENTGAGQVIYTTTSSDSSDIASGNTSYSIGGTDAPLFSINPSTGAVTFLADPNYEAKASYSFTVTATDSNDLSSEAKTVLFSVKNVDEPSTGDVSIVGILLPGHTLSVNDTLDDPDGISVVNYIWKANDVVIGTGKNYTLTADDAGKEITVVASYIDGYGTSENRTSTVVTDIPFIPNTDTRKPTSTDKDNKPGSTPRLPDTKNVNIFKEPDNDSTSEKYRKQQQSGAIADLTSHVEKLLLASAINKGHLDVDSNFDTDTLMAGKKRIYSSPVVQTVRNQPNFVAQADTQSEALFLENLDKIRQQFQKDELSDSPQQVDVQIMLGTTIAFTAGFVSWILRGGALLSSFMSTVPLLNRFDPVPILNASKKKNGNVKVSDDDSDLKNENLESVLEE